jgi:peptidyl-prolyl cis-trans isomerase B (cyclophilin B)
MGQLIKILQKMKALIKICSPLLILLFFWSCNTKKESSDIPLAERKSVEMVTNYGTMVMELYNETPLHRDNFIKLVEADAYDSLLFHRVIKNFMIQGGGPESYTASSNDTLGDGDVSYTIAAEFNPDLFHIKGALAAARTNNPKRESSGSQFYIVQGKVFNDSLLALAESRINRYLAEHFATNDSLNKPILEAIEKAKTEQDTVLYRQLNDRLDTIFKTYTNFEKYTIPEKHRTVYKSIGGTPHLDQNYTVFGQVIKGLEVVDSIASVETGMYARPISDVRILSARVLGKE